MRKERLADEIRDVLASCFTGGQMNDPRLEGVTVTAVKLSADLQLASVYFRMIVGSDTKEEDAKKALERAEGFFRRKLSQALDIRRLPALRFFFDESIERGSHIEQLLAKLD